jgi:hypothetical protein
MDYCRSWKAAEIVIFIDEGTFNNDMRKSPSK